MQKSDFFGMFVLFVVYLRQAHFVNCSLMMWLLDPTVKMYQSRKVLLCKLQIGCGIVVQNCGGRMFWNLIQCENFEGMNYGTVLLLQGTIHKVKDTVLLPLLREIAWVKISHKWKCVLYWVSVCKCYMFGDVSEILLLLFSHGGTQIMRLARIMFAWVTHFFVVL